MRIKRMAVVASLLFAFAILAYPLTAGAVVNWTKNATAVLSGGTNPLTDYDAGGIERPMVIIDGTTYRMYYTGKGIVSGVTGVRLLYGTSSDGITWTADHAISILPLGGSGAFDENHVGFCWVIKDGTTYKMWYSGNANVDPDTPGWQIGYVESSDGITWNLNRSTTPVLALGNPGTWDAEGVGAPTVVKDEMGTYHMWYFGWNETEGQMGFGYATSTNGTNWNRLGRVINPGSIGSWDNWEMGMPSVIKDGSVFRMWYYGIQSDGGAPDMIGYAYSVNGFSWTKYPGNPVIMNGSQTGSFDEYGAWDPMVIKDGNTYKIWYVGSSNCTQDGCLDRVGYATSSAYNGPDPKLDNVSVVAINMAGTPPTKQLQFNVIPQGPSPIDMNAFYVEGPNGFVGVIDESMIRDIMGEQWVSGASNVASFDPSKYNGTYTFKLFANNGRSVEKSIAFTVPSPEIPVPDDGVSGLDRRIVMGAGEQSGVTEYINGTTPTFKWKPYLGASYWYRVRVWDLKQPNRLRCWWQSTFAQGVAVDQDMTATVPDASYLKSNSNYVWEIEVSTTDQIWTAHHRARSTPYSFYTGAKGSDPMPAGSVYVYGNRSLANGDQTIFGARVPGLGIFDIASFPSALQVLESGVTPIFLFNPRANNMGYYVQQPNPPNDYSGPIPSIASSSTMYRFSVTDIGSTSYTEDVTFVPNLTVPQITKADGMVPADNSYLNTLQPTFTWNSKGSAWYHRVRITSWNGLTIYSSTWTNGVAEGAQMSVAIPANVLQNGVYRWMVEVADTNSGAVINRTQSQRQTITLGTGAQGGARTPFVAWGPGKSKLAISFSNYGTDNGLWVYDGASWQHPSNWIPSDMIAWGNSSLALVFSGNGADNDGLWIYNGTSWSHPTTWIPDKVVSWGTGSLAVVFTNQGTGNGLWTYNGTSWDHLSTWMPDNMIAWGSSGLAVVFSNYGADNGMWTYNGTSWDHPTTWIPNDLVAYGSNSLALIFSNYGADNGMWTYNGTSWDHPTTWIPDGMVAWGTNSLAMGFSNYGTGNGMWTYDGTIWNQPTTWIPDIGVAWGSNSLALAFSNYGADNGMWTYNGTSWDHPTTWIPDGMVAWGTNSLAMGFSNYGTGNGMWTYDGTTWKQPTTWIPGY